MTVVTLGAHIVDVLARPVGSLPEGQEAALVEEVRLTAAGSAAGTAVGLATLGRHVVSLGAIGDDELGDFLLASMTRHGVDVSNVVRRADVPTSASVLPIRPDGQRASLHSPGANPTFGASDVPPDLLMEAQAVHVGGPDVCLGLLTDDFQHTLRRARDAGALITMDLLSTVPELLDAASVLLPYIDYVLPNEEQALRMTGKTEALSAAQGLLDAGATGVVVTLGSEGSLVVTANSTVRVPPLDVVVLDTTGCGDAYCAGFITGLLDGLDVEASARLGTAAASTVATGLGSNAGLTDLPSLSAMTERIQHA